MLCKSPYMKGKMACGCGQCMPCRINKSSQWTDRLELERTCQPVASFVTLTYRKECLPLIFDSGCGIVPRVQGNLAPEDLRNFLKRFRKKIAKEGFGEIRFFAVGEYGEFDGRPHYHLAVFGFPGCLLGATRRDKQNRPICCGVCRTVHSVWGKGRIDVAELNKDLSRYITGYVTKKWTKEDSWTEKKLRGRHPEFVRMSLKPGIGAIAIKKLVTGTVQSRMGTYVKSLQDAPAVLRLNTSLRPLGKYLRRKFREALGRGPDTPEPILAAYYSELEREYQEYKGTASGPDLFKDARSAYFSKNKEKIKAVEKRFKMFQKGRTL